MSNVIKVGHSPDPDDAFMFYALTFNKFDTQGEKYEHHLVDIETLNREADRGHYEVTALSFHAYPYVADKYVLLPHGASFGDNYGPMIIAKEFKGGDPLNWLEGKTIAVPGTRTSAFLALHLWANHKGKKPNFKTEVIPFDTIISEVAKGKFDGGLIIHEGQLTYHEEASGSLKKVVDMGEWWKVYTAKQGGLPLPLGGNGIRRDLGTERIKKISRHLHDSIKWGLDHRDEALGYALKYARDMGKDKADKFVGMYVNHNTLKYDEAARESVRLFLREGYKSGVLKNDVQPEWVD